jgi:hypothetical protein
VARARGTSGVTDPDGAPSEAPQVPEEGASGEALAQSVGEARPDPLAEEHVFASEHDFWPEEGVT